MDTSQTEEHDKSIEVFFFFLFSNA